MGLVPLNLSRDTLYHRFKKRMSRSRDDEPLLKLPICITQSARVVRCLPMAQEILIVSSYDPCKWRWREVLDV
ncbi:MAG: hypothetical protein AAEJ59_07585 [Arenicellales bacterium]